MKAKVKETADAVIKNAKLILDKTKSREAYINYMSVRDLQKLLIVQDQTIRNLSALCTDAGKTIKNYKKLTRITQDYVGETAWQRILEQTYKESEKS